MSDTALKKTGLQFIRPMEPKLVEAPPCGGLWQHEIKFDGFRTQLVIDNGVVRAFTKGGADWTNRYGPIVEAAANLKVEKAIIDGEVYLPDKRGAPDFPNLHSAIPWKGSSRSAWAAATRAG